MIKKLCDEDIREPLFDFLEEYYGKIRILEEKQIGRSRADIVMVRPDEIAGIEIKSDVDTYVRLKRQVPDYDRYFDRNYVAAGASHGLHMKEHVPEWWGIITVEWLENGMDFYLLREAKDSPKTDPRRKLELLWRPELAHIQEINRLAKYRQKSKAFVIGKLLEKVPEKVLREQVSQELFERDYTRIEQTIREYKEGKSCSIR